MFSPPPHACMYTLLALAPGGLSSVCKAGSELPLMLTMSQNEVILLRVVDVHQLKAQALAAAAAGGHGRH